MESCQDSVHQAGEGGRSVAETEGYLIELKELSAACAESGLLLALFLDGDLPVPAFEIQRRKPVGAMKSVEEIVDSWDGMGVFDSCCVESSKIDTEAEAAVHFLDHDYGGSPGGSYDTGGEHLLHLRHLFSPDGRVLAAIWLAKRKPFSFNSML